MTPAHPLRPQQLASWLLSLALVWGFHQMSLSRSVNRFPPIFFPSPIFLISHLRAAFNITGGKAPTWEDFCSPSADSSCRWSLECHRQGFRWLVKSFLGSVGECWSFSPTDGWSLPSEGFHWARENDVSLESPLHNLGEVRSCLCFSKPWLKGGVGFGVL